MSQKLFGITTYYILEDDGSLTVKLQGKVDGGCLFDQVSFKVLNFPWPADSLGLIAATLLFFVFAACGVERGGLLQSVDAICPQIPNAQSDLQV